MQMMKRLTLIGLLLSGFFISTLSLAEEAPATVKQLAPSLAAWGKNPVLVDAVKQQNAQGLSLDAIKKRDVEWMKATGVTPFMKSLLDNKAGSELKKLESSKPYFTELFLMDGLGANVAMSNKTSDYWQGDEDKFTESFKGGEGALHIGKVKFDKSSQAYLVQISVPVIDGTKAIGALTIGVNVDELEKHNK